MDQDYPNLETMLIDEIIGQDESLQDLLGAMGETVGETQEEFFELCGAVVEVLKHNDAIRELALKYMIARACRYWVTNRYCNRRVSAQLPEYHQVEDRFAKSREMLEWARGQAGEVTARPKAGND